MLIRNIRIFRPDRTFQKGSVRVEGELIAAVYCGDEVPDPLPEEEVIDGTDDYLLPGMIDLHLHGAKGCDLNDGEPGALETIARYEASVGVTSIAPATMTVAVPDLISALEQAAEFHARQEAGECTDCAYLAGINMEGPFISPVRRGAQNPKNILPRSASLFHEFQTASGGLIRLIGIAPEEEGIVTAEEFIEEIHRTEAGSTHVALAHSNADYEHAKAAFDAGADHVVHLFNAMPGLGHRKPGLIGAAAENPKVTAELICDGIHIHPSAVRAAFSLFGPERLILISDSIRATGMEDGSYLLGGLSVTVRGRRAELTEGGNIAGSVTPLTDCVREAVAMGISLGDAVGCATLNPAKKLGIDGICGSIEAGKRADLLIWDSDLKQKRVFLRGRPL